MQAFLAEMADDLNSPRGLAVLADTDARMKGLGTLPAEMELQLCLGRRLGA